VFQDVLTLTDCVQHGPKWQYIGQKNNGSRNSEIAARSVFCTNACWKFIQNASAVYQNVFTPWIVSGTAQNGNTSATKRMGHEIMKLLPEVYFAPKLAGNLSKMHQQCIRMFFHLRTASGMAQNGNTSATKTMGHEIMKLLPEVFLAPMLARN